MNGVLPLNKPAGMTSFQAVREVRRALGEKRVGHAGTLDPTAVGMLPICVGRATRFVDYFHLQPKRYRCVVRFGQRSNTLDTEGEITDGGDAGTLDADAIRAVLPRFVGEIDQVPPMHSAVRHEGRHLYELARKGEEVERAARRVTIYSAELVGFRPGRIAEADIDVVSGKGAYMRVIAAELGDALDTGALLAWLERTTYGPLTIETAVTMEQLLASDDRESLLLPVDVAVDTLPRLDVAPPLASRLRRGQSVFVPRLPDPRPQGECRAHDAAGDLVAIGELQGNLLRPTKVFASA